MDGKKDNKNFKSLLSLIFQLDRDSSNSKNQSELPKVKPIEKLNIKDPLYKDQWYLKNTGQFGGQAGIDINIELVWKQGYTGKGIKIGILDHPVDYKHPDLKDNLPEKNVAFYGSTADLRCRVAHGTQVAGLIAARDNNIGIRGVAPRAILYSYGLSYDLMKETKKWTRSWQEAMKRQELSEIAVYNGSFSDAKNSGLVFALLTSQKRATLYQVTTNGFGGKGSSIIFSAGNSSLASPSNASMNNHYAVIVVNSIFKEGTMVGSGSFAGGGTIGANLWVVAPTGTGYMGGAKMITTDNVGNCGSNKNGDYSNFGMTSGAAPLVSGIVALIRQANPNLRWRDVKLILAESAKKLYASSSEKQNWKKTGKMYSNSKQTQQYHRTLAFGLVDATAAVSLAKKWKLLPTMKKKFGENSDVVNIQKKNVTYFTAINIQSDMQFIESVVVDIEFKTIDSGMLDLQSWELSLVAPDGKKALFFTNGEKAILSKDDGKMVLAANAFLGSENINGEWKLNIKQKQKIQITQIKNWKLTIRGH